MQWKENVKTSTQNLWTLINRFHHLLVNVTKQSCLHLMLLKSLCKSHHTFLNQIRNNETLPHIFIFTINFPFVFFLDLTVFVDCKDLFFIFFISLTVVEECCWLLLFYFNISETVKRCLNENIFSQKKTYLWKLFSA